jgi:hypothetical protein
MSTWILLTLLGCPPPDYEGPAVDTSNPTVANTDPSIRLLFPQSSTSDVYCPLFTVVADIDNYDLSEENYGLTPTEGQGHWHLTEGSDILGATADEFLELSEPLDEGDHNLVAVLVGNDHQEFEVDGTGFSWLVEITVSDASGCLGDQGGGDAAGDSGTAR